MTCGIYMLNFEGTDKKYIGQSLNIEYRYVQHQSKFRCNIATKALQAAYNTYGMPSYTILVECLEHELDSNEDEAIHIFDSVNNGFNTVSKSGTRTSLKGEDNPMAKYTNDEITEAFSLLVYTELSQPEISKITGIGRQTINHISNGHKYLWLKDTYPKEYSILEDKRGTRKTGAKCAKDLGIVYPKIVSPEGEIFEVFNTSEFSRIHGMDSGSLGRLLNYKAKSYKGWVRLTDTVN